MNEFILHNAAIALPAEIWPDPVSAFALSIRGGKIDKILKESEIGDFECEKTDLGGGILSPGFIDTQVNGGGGTLFNSNPNIENIKTIKTAHLRFGTTSMLPTLISDDFDKMRAAIEAVNGATKSGEVGIIGIHLEGPFLNEAKKGVHDKEKFRIIDDEAIKLICSLKHGKTLITLAPEKAPDGAIAALSRQGIIIAAGHSGASFDEIQSAIEDGLSGFTHLFNAMSQIEARAPNIVGAALANPQCYSGIIIDLVHVHSQNILMAHKILGSKALMLVTDAMPCVGTGAKEFELYGKKIIVKDGSCFDENGTLAGSALDMASAARNAHKKVGLPLGQSLQMASETPAKFLGLDKKIGSIRAGLDADLVHLSDDLTVQTVWQKGHKVIH